MMTLPQGRFFIIRLSSSLKRGWFGFSCTWIRLVIWWYFRQVRWGRWGRWIIWNIDTISCRMDMSLFLCVSHCGFWSLLIFRNLLLLIHISVHFSLFLLFFCLFLCFCNFFLFSSSFFLTLNIFLYFLSPLHCITMTQYTYQYLLSLVYREKSAEACGCLFLSGWDQRASLW